MVGINTVTPDKSSIQVNILPVSPWKHMLWVNLITYCCFLGEIRKICC